MNIHPCHHIACNDNQGAACPVLVLEASLQILRETKEIREHASVVALRRSLHTSPPERFYFFSVKRTLISTRDVRERVQGCINRPLGCCRCMNQWRNRECIKPLSGNSASKAGFNEAH